MASDGGSIELTQCDQYLIKRSNRAKNNAVVQQGWQKNFAGA
jgi:hypothetical protein